MKLKVLSIYLLLAGYLLLQSACREIALYERLVNIPGGAWQSDRIVELPIEIADTALDYNIYATIRHTSMYAYRNIWIRMGIRQPNADSTTYQDFELPLATNEQWLGTGMNDVYERRVRLFGVPVRFSQAGQAVFTLQQIMRDDPLPGVLQVGIRIEPVP
ncbi:MAG TPA: gliding motility lipoprotein GldH [Phnomibacter sp.]|nr:gliding motility lipoprotein GldH [Phnomibacter sp.]